MMNSVSLYTSLPAWVFVFLALYFAYLIFWGMRSARWVRSPGDLFVAGGDLPAWVIVTSMTVTAFAGWLIVSEPGLVLRDGFPAVYLGFSAIVIPVLGALLSKRQWALSRRLGFVTAGEMLGSYFNGHIVRIYTVIVAVLFAVPLLGLMLGAAADLLHIASGLTVPSTVMLWALAAITVIGATLGGTGAAARSGPLQMIVITAGLTLTGVAAYHLAGGFESINAALAKVASAGAGHWGTTKSHGGGDFSALFALSGVAQWTDGLGRETPDGGPWTALMAMSFVLALAGLQLSPAMTMLTFSAEDPKAFAPQQVWASACVGGLFLFVLLPVIGIAGLLLGGDGALAAAGLAIGSGVPDLSADRQALVSGAFVHVIAESVPWLGGLLAICLAVAATASVAIFVTAAGAAVTRDLFVAYFQSEAGDRAQLAFARIVMLIAVALAALMATFAPAGMAVLASATFTLAIQLLPAALGATWIPWFTRQGVQAGLITGAIVAIGADPLGQLLTTNALPWGVWPWTIHAAAWGLAANFTVTVLGSAVSQSDGERQRRQAFHAIYDELRARRPLGRGLVTTAWVVCMTWVFFAFGPAAVVGNYLFGEPSAGYEAWGFNMPSIWAWQLIWWGLGVLIVWFLAYRLDLATEAGGRIITLPKNAAAQFGRAKSHAA